MILFPCQRGHVVELFTYFQRSHMPSSLDGSSAPILCFKNPEKSHLSWISHVYPLLAFITMLLSGLLVFIKQTKCDLRVTHDRDLSVQKAPLKLPNKPQVVMKLPNFNLAPFLQSFKSAASTTKYIRRLLGSQGLKRLSFQTPNLRSRQKRSFSVFVYVVLT